MPDTNVKDLPDSTTTVSESVGSGGIIDHSVSVKNKLEFGDDTTLETSGKLNLKETMDSATLGYNLEQKLTHDVNDRIRVTNRNASGVEIGTKGAKVGAEAEASVRVGTDDFYEQYTANASTDISTKNGIESKFGGTYTQKNGLVEESVSESAGMGFDGKKVSANYEAGYSAMVGNDQFSEEAYGKSSVGVGSDGSIEGSATVGGKVKAGAVETGFEHTSSASHSESDGKTTDTHTEKTQMSSSVEVADGVKVKNTSGVEMSEKFTDSEESSTEETSVSFSSSTRIEVDAEKAGTAAAAAATVFNAQMGVMEGVLKEATKITSESTTEKSQNEESSEKANEDAQIEEEAKAQQEHEDQLQAEADAAAAEEQSTDEEVQAAAEEQAQEQQMADEEVEAQAEAEAEAQAQAEEEAQAQAEAEESYDYDYSYGY